MLVVARLLAYLIMDCMKSEMESMKAQLETVSELITSIYQGKAKPTVKHAE